MVPAKINQSVLAVALLGALLSSVSTFSVYGHSGDALNAAWTDEPPKIDGSMSEGEWKGDVMNIPTKTHVRNYDASISVSAMNDDKYLYLNMQVFPPEDVTLQASNYELVAFYIDSNHDGALNQNSDLVLSLYSTRDYWSSGGVTNYKVGPYAGATMTGLQHQFGWTGSGWVYEAKIPFTFDSGYTWAVVGDEVGFAADWVTYEGPDQQNINFEGTEEIIVPSGSVAPFGAPQVSLWDVTKTAYPAKFVDISLAGGSSEGGSSTTNTGSPDETPESDVTDQTASIGQSDANLGPYLAIGIAIAGGAVAGAIALTRKKSARTTTQ